MIERGSSLTVIAQKNRIAKSTVSDIKKNKEKILAFKKDMAEMGMSSKAKMMRLGDDKQLDRAVYVWFKQKRMEGTPIKGPMLCEKAVQFSKRMHGVDAAFAGSTGWQWRFCKRHGIRNLSLQGEK